MQSSGYGGVSEFQQFMVDGCNPPFFSISSTTTAPSSAAPAATEPLKYHPLLFHHHPHPSQTPPLPPPFQPQFAPFPHSIPAATQQLFHQGHQFQLFHHHLGGLDHDSGQENPGGSGEPSFLADAVTFRLGVNESTGGCSDDDDTTLKELSLRLDYFNSSNKRCNDKELESSPSPAITNYSTKYKDMVASAAIASGHGNYKHFSELDAICKPGSGGNQTASGSGLTGDDNPLASALEPSPEASAGDQVPPAEKKPSGRKKRRRREMRLAAAFFERLVKQLMEHQETLHRKFLEAMERRDSERSFREEAWRRRDAATPSQDGSAATAAARQDAIAAFLEKFTGEKIDLPTFAGAPNFPENSTKEIVSTNHTADQFSTSRWPKAEVQALIRVRTELDARFQEPGLKGPLWEDVSARMAAFGFRRSSKRCKEKWENINKYFRKTKENGKKRPHNAKTCSYFHQLDQLYSAKNPDAVAISAGDEEEEAVVHLR